jgi:hypothetical protein
MGAVYAATVDNKGWDGSVFERLLNQGARREGGRTEELPDQRPKEVFHGVMPDLLTTGHHLTTDDPEDFEARHRRCARARVKGSL